MLCTWHNAVNENNAFQGIWTRKEWKKEVSSLILLVWLHALTWKHMNSSLGTRSWTGSLHCQRYLQASRMGPIPLLTAGGHCNLGCYRNCKNPQTTKTADGFRPPKSVICHVRKCQMPRRHRFQTALLRLQILRDPRGEASRSCSLPCKLSLLLYVLSGWHHSLHRGGFTPHRPCSMKMWPAVTSHVWLTACSRPSACHEAWPCDRRACVSRGRTAPYVPRPVTNQVT